MTRTKLLLAATMVATTARAVHAQSCTRTLEQVITTCDVAFSGSGLISLSARGWCYLINTASCTLP